MIKDKDEFTLINNVYKSRLIMGTSLFPNQKILEKSLMESGTEIITVAIRRVDLNSKFNIFELLKNKYTFLPNTAGCYSSKEALLTAELARESLETNLLKLELIADEKTLLPDSVELIHTARLLIKNNFKVLAYCSDDPIICKKLEDVGCTAVMPLISPIGSGLGVRNEHNLNLIREFCKCLVIVDAGIGRPSDAAKVMELGFDAVLLNSAVARSMDPIKMSKAMKLAVQAGRDGYTAGIIEKNRYAKRSTEFVGKISNF